MQDLMKDHHIERLQAGICNVESGAVFFDLANFFERMSAHAGNVALHILKRIKADRSFDEMHGHSQDFNKESYQKMLAEYKNKYLLPVKYNGSVVS